MATRTHTAKLVSRRPGILNRSRPLVNGGGVSVRYVRPRRNPSSLPPRPPSSKSNSCVLCCYAVNYLPIKQLPKLHTRVRRRSHGPSTAAPTRRLQFLHVLPLCNVSAVRQAGEAHGNDLAVVPGADYHGRSAQRRGH